MSEIQVNTIKPFSGGTVEVIGDISASGKLIAKEYLVQSVTESAMLVNGSNQFGNSADDTHTFTGNITASNDISASGTITANAFIGSISATGGDSLFGDITASGNVSASGDISTSENLNVEGSASFGTGTVVINGTAGQVTASGNISASGNLIGNFVFGDKFHSNDNVVFQHSAGITNIGTPAIPNKFFGSNIEFAAPITASNISASGAISASELLINTSGGGFDTENMGVKITPNLMQVSSSFTFKFGSGSQNNALLRQGSLILRSTVADNTGSLQLAQLNTGAGRIRCPRDFLIALDAAADGGGEDYEPEKFTVGTGVLPGIVGDIGFQVTHRSTNGDIDEIRHVTASGNISASSLVTNEINGLNQAGITLTGNVTASGQISASGGITSSGINLQGEDPIISLTDITNDYNFRIKATNRLGIIATEHFSNDVFVATNFTGHNGNVYNTTALFLDSGDGTFNINGAEVIVSPTGDITASGDISSSGELSALTVSDVLAAAVVTQIDNDEIPIAKLAEDAVTVTAGTGLTGGGSITLGGSATVNVVGGTGVTANANDVAIGQDVATTADVLFNHITASGNISSSGDVIAHNYITHTQTVAAAGSSIGDATAIASTAAIVFGTTDDAAKGVKLPAVSTLTIGQQITVHNTSAATLEVYPTANDRIFPLVDDAPATVPVNTAMVVTAFTADGYVGYFTTVIS